MNLILAAPVGGTSGEPFEEALLPWPKDAERWAYFSWLGRTLARSGEDG